MKKYLPTILAVAAIVLVVGFVVWAATRPDTPDNSKLQALSAEDKAALTQGESAGVADAKVVLTEFGDFQCPACGQWHPFIRDTVLAQYGDKIKFVFKNYPLTKIHKNAQIAAQAAEAASQQGQYWPMHNKLYDTQSNWENKSTDQAQADFEAFAAELGLDVGRFKSDITSQRVKDIIAADVALGDKLGLPGTPSFIINGAIVSTKNGFDDLIKALEQALAAQAATPPAQ